MKEAKNLVKDKLLNKIKDKTAILGVVGLGYIGLPLAVEAAKAGFKTIGFDTQEKRVRWVNEGHNYIRDILDMDLKKVVQEGLLYAASDFSLIKDVDAICICVPTPLDIYQQPDLSYVKMSTEIIAKYLHKGMLVVLESTTYPGTTEELVKPILEEKSGLKCGEDFFLAFSPERIDPGNLKYKINNTPKVVGGITPSCTEVVAFLYRQVLQNEVHIVSSPKVAEMEKIYENTFRNINIALANEMAILCHRMGIDIWEVIEAAKTKPYGFMPFYPGPGIGGHCIPLDPFYLTWKAREYNFHTRLIELAGEINRNMPEYIVERITKILSKKFKKSINGAKVLLIGVAYKKNIDDLRESPALEIIKKLEEDNAVISYYDPYIPDFVNNGKKYKSLKELTEEEIKARDIVIIVTDHTVVNYEMIVKNAKIIFDTRNVIKFKNKKVEKL
jgi:UDP-N-acetyl-D-glucosamine dehydrogenase